MLVRRQTSPAYGHPQRSHAALNILHEIPHLQRQEKRGYPIYILGSLFSQVLP